MSYITVEKSLPTGQGMFISVDGFSKSGKTTAVAKLKDSINHQLNVFHKTDGLDYVLEMSAPEFQLGKKINELIDRFVIDRLTSGFLLASLLREYTQTITSHCRKEGKVVIVDSFVLTGHMCLYSLDLDTRQRLFDLAIGYDGPDMALFMELDPETAANRSHQERLKNYHPNFYLPPLDVDGYKEIRRAVDCFFDPNDELFDPSISSVNCNDGFGFINVQLEAWVVNSFMPTFHDRHAMGEPKTIGDLIREQHAKGVTE